MRQTHRQGQTEVSRWSGEKNILTDNRQTDGDRNAKQRPTIIGKNED